MRGSEIVVDAEDLEKKKLVRRLEAGDGRALFDVLEAERELFYDYLLRMTGQVSRSMSVIDEVYESWRLPEKAAPKNLVQLRTKLFAVARTKLLDIWNAHTLRLSNSLLEPSVEKDKISEALERERATYRALDRSLRSLVGTEREAVILRIRAELDFADIAAVMGIGSSEAERLFYLGMQRIDAECSGLVSGPEPMLQRMPCHEVPPRSTPVTMDLGVIMQGIKAKPVGLSSPLRLCALVVLLVLLLGWYFFPHYVSDFFDF